MKTNKTQNFPLKGGIPGILRVVRRALVVKDIQSIVITPKGVEVTREVEDPAEEALPGGADEIDMQALLERLEITAHPFNPDEHGAHSFYFACARVAAAKRVPIAVVAPSWGLLSAWLGLEKGEQPVTVFGMKLVIVPKLVTNGRVLVLGARQYMEFLSDVDYAIAMDMGV